MTHRTPPETIETRTLKREATTPASKLPSAGPDYQLSISIDARRPRNESGMVWFQITPRKMPLIMSAAPARPRKMSAHVRLVENPKPMMANPQAVAEEITPDP